MNVSVSALFQAGRLADTIEVLGADLRNDPTDVRKRTFLFELLCFAGEYDRADKHLELLADASKEAGLGAWLYRAALHAERLRQGMFREGSLPRAPERPPVPARVNGKSFAYITDADPRIGARLEVFAAGQYMLIPFEHLASAVVEAPRRLRDTLWAPARLVPAPGFKGGELGEVLLPALAPLSWQHPDDAVRLGRATVWEDGEGGEPRPMGQKLLLAGEEEEIPFLELRTIEFGAAQPD